MIQFKVLKPQTTTASFLALPVCEDDPVHDDPDLAAIIDRARALGEFSGKPGEEILFYDPPGTGVRRVALIGIGKRLKITREILRNAAGRAVRSAISKKLAEAWIAVPTAALPVPVDDARDALIQGACLANHVFDRYKNEKKSAPLKKIVLAGPVPRGAAGRARRIETICEGTRLARDWVSTPSNDKRPDAFIGLVAERARHAGLTVSLLDAAALRRQKFGGILAVGAGSQSAPGLVVMEYKPGRPGRTVVLVGKGVTFDSGGINLKPSQSLDEMKIDMAGAAAVAATLITAAALKPSIHLVGLLPVVENMPSGTATRPGDIITTFSGKTVEIGNTDAEGRLILADAMAYALKRFKPEILIDIATLTGACVVALGEKMAGVFSPDEDLAQRLLDAADRTGERCWRLPLPEDYRELMHSELADIRNLSSSRWGGAITAALFLKDFVGDVRWAHLDIAGPASQKKADAIGPAGGTGFGVRLFWEFIDALSH